MGDGRGPSAVKWCSPVPTAEREEGTQRGRRTGLPGRPCVQPAAPPPRRKAGAAGRERQEAEGGGGRRAERLFVVRFDPEGEPETLTFLA